MKSEPVTQNLTLKSNLKELRKIDKLSRHIAAELKLSEDQRNNLSIAFTEAVGNAIVHGNKQDPHKIVSVDIILYADRVTIKVQDQGKGFNPETLPDPLDPANLMLEHGRGIFILKSLTDETDFSFESGGTTLTFTLIKQGGS